jgi:hypothetical protein
MEQSEYIECSFDGTRSEDYLGGFARFVGCSFKDVDIRGWRSDDAEFIDCMFTGRLEECIFYGTVPEKDRPWVGREKNEFRGNDFSGCDLVGVAFRTGIDLNLQCLPAGPEYLYLPDAASAMERARLIVQEWYDPGLRKDGLLLLQVAESELDSGQRQLLLNSNDYRKTIAGEVIDGVFAALHGT